MFRFTGVDLKFKSKLALPEYNKIYLSVIAFIVFTLHQVKQRKFFGRHPVCDKKSCKFT